MIRINLLPHREQARKERRHQFISLSVLVLIVAAAVWFVGHTLIASRIEAQERDNKYLKDKIDELDKDIAEIKRLREQMQALLARKQVIESLQANRAEPVVLFNEMAKQMPSGVVLSLVKQTGREVHFEGFSQSNARVSQLMRNFDSSPILEKPVLGVIKASTFNKRVVGQFELNMTVERAPSVDESAPQAGANKLNAAKGVKQ